MSRPPPFYARPRVDKVHAAMGRRLLCAKLGDPCLPLGAPGAALRLDDGSPPEGAAPGTQQARTGGGGRGGGGEALLQISCIQVAVLLQRPEGRSAYVDFFFIAAT